MNFKKRVSGSWTNTPHYIHNTSTDTITTLPAVLYPNDTTATAGLKGDMVQSSQPTPESPVMPQGTGDMTRNLFPLDENKLHVGRIENNGTIDYEIGTITVGTDSVTYEANATWRGFYTDLIQVNENEKLTFSPNDSADIVWSCNCYDENGSFLGKAFAQSAATIRTFTLLTGTKTVRVSVTSSSTVYTISQPMLNTGSTALPYEPYGVKIPISNGGENLFDQSDFTLLQVTSTLYRYGTSLGVLPQGVYTFNATKSTGAQSIYLTAILNGVYSQTTISSLPFSFTADGNSEYIIRTANNTGTTWDAEKYSDMMLNTGSKALPYEPYHHTTTNTYLGEVETVRYVKKLVLDGTEDFQSISSGNNKYFRLSVEDFGGIHIDTTYCTHFESVSITSSTTNVGVGVIHSSVLNKDALGIRPPQVSTTSLEDFTTYLTQQYNNGTPVTVWYVLTSPTRGIVNEPLMKIGEYADTLGNISIPVTAGGDTLSVGTTVQPSEVTVNYKGWHPVADVHERDNGAWT